MCSQESSGPQDNTTKDFSNLNRNDQSADTVKQNSSKSLTGSCERLSIDSVSVCVVQGSLATPPTLSRSGNPPIDWIDVSLPFFLPLVHWTPQNKDNETALHCGAQYGHSAVVNLLLTYGADPSIRNVKDETALDLAALYGRSVSTSIRKRIFLTLALSVFLFHRLETVEILLKKHPELIEPYKSGLAEGVSTFRITPLHAASRNGHRYNGQYSVQRATSDQNWNCAPLAVQSAENSPTGLA